MDGVAVNPKSRVAPAVGILAAAALLACAAASVFRLSAAEAYGFVPAISGPRLLLTVAIGAALAASGWLARQRGGDLLQRELWLFGASAGGAFGGAMWTARFGPAAATLGSIAGAALLASVLNALYRRPRAWLWLLVLAQAVSFFLCVYGVGYARGAVDASRARLAWWGGDLSHATWASAGVIALSACALLALAALRASLRSTIDVLLLGLAVGAGGPIAFVGAVGVWFATRAGVALVPGKQLALAALGGAAGLTFADAVQRKLLGGYAFPPAAVTALLALPFVYAACARMKPRAERARWRSMLETAFVVAVTGFGYAYLLVVAKLVLAFT